MKKLLLIVIILFSGQVGKAQGNYFNYLDSTVEWHYYSFPSEFVTIYFDGDTLINGKFYYKQYEMRTKLYYDSNQEINCVDTFFPDMAYPKFFRESDSLQFLVYDPTSNSEIVLADFRDIVNLQVGDTFPNLCPILAIDTIYLNNRPLKEYYGVYYTPTLMCVEGVMVDEHSCTLWLDGYRGLECFTKQNQTIGWDSISNLGPVNCNTYPRPNRVNHFHNTLCNASFTLMPDTSTPHNWFAIANIIGTPPYNYSWSWGDGTTDSTVYPSHTYASAGYYTICLTITDALNCTTTFCDSSTYLNKMEATMVSITVIPSVAADLTIHDNQLNIFPNPSNTNLNIRANSNQAVLNDLSGKTLLTIKLNKGQADVDVSNLDNGIYFLQTDNGQTQKLLIQH